MSDRKADLLEARQLLSATAVETPAPDDAHVEHLAGVFGAEYDRLVAVEAAAASYVMAGLCGNQSTSAELLALITAVRTNPDFEG